MEVIETVRAMQERADQLRLKGHTIGFVPTMGFLHEGHLELMRVAKRHCDILVVSIFVNPTQFGPNEDFEKYPRDMEGDMEKAEGVGTDIIFMPDAAGMYPNGFKTRVRVSNLTEKLCGISRPVHFEGVTTVVTKLFNAVKPDMAVFGQKDFQQLTVISRMVTDLNMDVRIIGVPTVREPDGLAMSSRNKYLGREERKSALSLNRSLDMAEEMFKEGERSAEKIREAVISFIKGHPFTEIDYVSLCDPDTLEEMDLLGQKNLLALAVKVGATRLIDNRVISSPA